MFFSICLVTFQLFGLFLVVWLVDGKMVKNMTCKHSFGLVFCICCFLRDLWLLGFVCWFSDAEVLLSILRSSLIVCSKLWICLSRSIVRT